MKIRFAAAALLISLILSSCGAASDTAADNAGTPAAGDALTEAETTADPGADSVLEMSFDKDINLLLPSVSWLTPNILSDEADGERVNDAQYALKTAMEERFGMTLKESYTGDIWSTSYISKLIEAG